MSDIPLIKASDPRDLAARDLIARHLALMAATSPEESVHALKIDELAKDGVSFYASFEHDTAISIGAFQFIEPKHAELKSMHVRDTHRGRGLARAMLDHLLEKATQAGATRISLETGTASQFHPARVLYARAGFVTCPPFGAYVEDPHSVFMTRAT